MGAVNVRMGRHDSERPFGTFPRLSKQKCFSSHFHPLRSPLSRPHFVPLRPLFAETGDKRPHPGKPLSCQGPMSIIYGASRTPQLFDSIFNRRREGTRSATTGHSWSCVQAMQRRGTKKKQRKGECCWTWQARTRFLKFRYVFLIRGTPCLSFLAPKGLLLD